MTRLPIVLTLDPTLTTTIIARQLAGRMRGRFHVRAGVSDGPYVLCHDPGDVETVAASFEILHKWPGPGLP